ncbi:MAG: SGNH/GDSL hydrolase family protein, partial [Planctomycetales bacterium]|nr:SGNH/GDSL hydrolase family protein [Planctomycetales bacterium]
MKRLQPSYLRLPARLPIAGVCLVALLGLDCSLTAAQEKKHGSVDLVFLGDSITKGVRPGVVAEETFPQLVAQQLEKQGLHLSVANEGIGGERTDQALQRLASDVIAREPRYVIVMYGTNDSYIDVGRKKSRLTTEAYRQNLQTIVERLQEAGIVPLLMTSPRWAATASKNGVGQNPNLALEPYVEVCRAVARDKQLTLIDHFAHWTEAVEGGQDLSEWTTDGCHPNPRGHRQLAQQITPQL